MKEQQDLSGKKFGRLSVHHVFDKTKNGISRWACKCSCGNWSVHRADHILTGHAKSCGCLLIEALQNNLAERIKRIEAQREKPFLDAKSKMKE